jgi:hypothetical protein
MVYHHGLTPNTGKQYPVYRCELVGPRSAVVGSYQQANEGAQNHDFCFCTIGAVKKQQKNVRV